MSMYGTCDAAKNWQECYTGHLEEIGFVSGLANPCVFKHKHRDIQMMVHGDDYVSVASEEDRQALVQRCIREAIQDQDKMHRAR